MFRDALKVRRPFSLGRFGDGEWGIIKNKPTGNKEFRFHRSASAMEAWARDYLIQSFQLNIDNYFVGIVCECCMGDEHRKMVEFSGLPHSQLTWSNIWVNSNYDNYLDQIVTQFSDYDVYLICNEKAATDNLPFHVKERFNIGHNAWVNNLELVEDMIDYIQINDIDDSLFLVAAGPLSSILCPFVFKACPNNTFLDIGSTLDPFLFGKNGYTRKYLKGGKTKERTCVW